jgi:hypothetical protein
VTPRRRSRLGEIHSWVLRRVLTSLDAADRADAAADFNWLRAEAWRRSSRAWLRVWWRELRALARTWWEERRAARRSTTAAPRTARAMAPAFAYDVRHAARGLVRDRSVTAFALLSLVLGMGVNATTIDLVDRLLLRGPDAIAHPDRLARIYRRLDTPVGAQTSPWLPLETYEHLRDGTHEFAVVGAYGVRDTTVGRAADSRMLLVGMSLGGFFRTLGTVPEVGRFFLPGEVADSAGPLVVLSDSLWRTSFSADPAVIGRSLDIDGVPHAVVGVAPPGFTGPDVGRVDAWTLADRRSAGAYNWKVVGRLRPGASVASASAEAQRLHIRATDDEPKWIGNAFLLAAPITYDDTASESIQARIATWMAAVSAIILTVTCANVVNLLLVRLARRQREIGVRVALGGSRSRIMRLVALEGLLLVVAGGAASLWIAETAGPVLAVALFPGGAGWAPAAVATVVLARCPGAIEHLPEGLKALDMRNAVVHEGRAPGLFPTEVTAPASSARRSLLSISTVIHT